MFALLRRTINPALLTPHSTFFASQARDCTIFQAIP
jgi:hypothetical protein